MKKSIKVVLILLWVCMIIVGISACGDSAGIDKEDLIDTPIAKEMSYVSATLPNAQVSLEDETGVEGDLSGHDNTLSTEDNIVEHEKAGYCDNTVTKISRESQMGRESCEVSFDGSDSVALTDLLLYLDYSDGICRCQPEYNVDKEYVYKFYQIATIGVLPSYTEQCSYAAIEMMMHGLPLIGTTAGGISEMIEEGKTGYKIHLKEEDNKKILNINELAIFHIAFYYTWKKKIFLFHHTIILLF